MSVNFTFNNGGNTADFDDAFIRKDLFTQGGLWVWGQGVQGQLGDNTLASKSSPVQTVAGGTNWKQVSGGRFHTAAIKTDGTLWLWGASNYGQLGNNGVTSRSSPVQTISGGSNWKTVGRAYGSHVHAIKTDGTLWLWGYNNYGQLGDGSSITHRSSPIQTVAGGTNWKEVSGGWIHTAAIKTDGTLWLWGYNYDGQLGDNTTATKSSPVQIIGGGTNWKLVSCGHYHNAAIKTDGTLWTWGQNGFGQLGNGVDITNRSSPGQTVSGGTNWKQMSAGSGHMVAIKTDGTLWTWGRNNFGQLGNNTVTHGSSPVQTVAGGTNWKGVGGGQQISSAIKTDGTLWLWGQGVSGQLGDNTLASKSSPVQTVAGGTNWKQALSYGEGSTGGIREDFY